jgi:hypothetical protein
MHWIFRLRRSSFERIWSAWLACAGKNLPRLAVGRGRIFGLLGFFAAPLPQIDAYQKCNFP